jgi:formate hydrogenlyase subunit 4
MARLHDEESPLPFILKVGNALLRIAALIVLFVAHWLLEKVMTFLFPAPYPPARILLEAISYIVFAFLYVYLLWDMVVVFVPRLRPKLYPGLERHSKDARV